MKHLYVRAARRVAAVPLLIALLWGLQLVGGAVAGSIAAWMTRTSLGPFGAPTDDAHAVFRIADLFSQHPAIPTAMISAMAVAAGLMWTARTLGGGLIFAWLGGKSRLEIGQLAISRLPALGAQAVWHLLWSIPAIALLAVVTGPLPVPARILMLSAAWAGSALAYDRIRAEVCLGAPERPMHPKTALRAAKWAFTHAPAWIASTALLLGQLACAGLAAWLALRAIGSASGVWPVRAASLLALLLSVLRVSLSVEATLTEHTDPAPDPATPR